MPNLHIACDFVFDVTRSLLIMQWTRCEYARTTRTPRWNSHLSSSLFPFIFLSLFYILTYLYLFVYTFSCDFSIVFSSRAEQQVEKKKTVFHFEKIFFFLYFRFLSVFFFVHFFLFLICIICSSCNRWNWISLILNWVIYVS